jgi:hypothetical protein
MTNSSDNLFKTALEAKAADEAAVKATQAAEETNTPDVTESLSHDDIEDAPQGLTEIDMLKSRARLMNIPFSNSIGVDSLRARIKARLEGEALAQNQLDVENTGRDARQPIINADTVTPPLNRPVVTAREKIKSKRARMMAEQMKLVRVRITNLNPSKKDLPGEIFTFANRVLGAVKKFIPYGEATDNGYHIPYCIYTQLKEREFMNIRTRKDSRGREIIETGMAREFAIEILPQLTTSELARLASAQAAAKGMD